VPRRDWSEIRKLMLMAETLKEYEFGKEELCGPTEDDFHFNCLINSGLVAWHDGICEQRLKDAVDSGLAIRRSVRYWITSAGHDYLETIRDEGIWKKTKDVVSETGGSATLEIIMSLATGFLKKKIEKHTGIEL